MNNAFHIPVLRDEVLRFLVSTPGGVYVDATLGGGGHAEGILEKIFPKGSLIGIDADADAQSAAKGRLHRFVPNAVFVHENNANIRSILQSHQASAIHGVLLDLGVSSFQLNEGTKGFSFRTDSVLDMRMDRRQSLDALTVVNSYSEEQLAEIFWKYGEERNSRRIARSVVEQRGVKKVQTTGELAAIIGRKVPEPFLTKTMARVFQALRIEVNKELDSLSTFLRDVVGFLVPGGRIVVISYHSLEDRIVKNFFVEQSRTKIRSAHKLVPDMPIAPVLRLLTKKPVIASDEEQWANPRSRSAKLRAAEKV